jgi:hypothetical protein
MLRSWPTGSSVTCSALASLSSPSLAWYVSSLCALLLLPPTELTSLDLMAADQLLCELLGRQVPLPSLLPKVPPPPPRPFPPLLFLPCSISCSSPTLVTCYLKSSPIQVIHWSHGNLNHSLRCHRPPRSFHLVTR